MSDVIITLRVMPEGVEVNLDNLEKKINAAISPKKIEREPIAFGLVALNVTTFVQDAQGQVEAVEKKLKGIEGVNDVEVIKMTRSL